MYIKRSDLIFDLTNMLKDIPTHAPLLIHTDIAHIGIIDKFVGAEKLAQDYEDVFDEALIGHPYIIPAYNYDFCSNGIFDVVKDLGQLGALSKHFSKKYPELRTRTPVFNFIIKNDHCLFNLNPVPNCFGLGSIHDQLRKNNGYVVLIGNTRNTFAHHAEETFPIGYRYTKKFRGKIIFNGNEIPAEVEFRVRPRAGAVEYSELDLVDAKEEGIIKVGKCGLTTMMWYNASDYYNFLHQKFKQNELYLLSEKSRETINKLWSLHGKPLTVDNCEA